METAKKTTKKSNTWLIALAIVAAVLFMITQLVPMDGVRAFMEEHWGMGIAVLALALIIGAIIVMNVIDKRQKEKAAEEAKKKQDHGHGHGTEGDKKTTEEEHHEEEHHHGLNATQKALNIVATCMVIYFMFIAIREYQMPSYWWLPRLVNKITGNTVESEPKRYSTYGLQNARVPSTHSHSAQPADTTIEVTNLRYTKPIIITTDDSDIRFDYSIVSVQDTVIVDGITYVASAKDKIPHALGRVHTYEFRPIKKYPAWISYTRRRLLPKKTS